MGTNRKTANSEPYTISIVSKWNCRSLQHVKGISASGETSNIFSALKKFVHLLRISIHCRIYKRYKILRAIYHFLTGRNVSMKVGDPSTLQA